VPLRDFPVAFERATIYNFATAIACYSYPYTEEINNLRAHSPPTMIE
jgi:hypothetical protein